MPKPEIEKAIIKGKKIKINLFEILKNLILS